MTNNPLRVLFLCTGNYARSILAEAVMNQLGKGRFIGYSAGSRPAGEPNPFAISLLQREGIDTSFARSKSWDEFAAPDAPKLDFILPFATMLLQRNAPIGPVSPYRHIGACQTPPP